MSPTSAGRPISRAFAPRNLGSSTPSFLCYLGGADNTASLSLEANSISLVIDIIHQKMLFVKPLNLKNLTSKSFSSLSKSITYAIIVTMGLRKEKHMGKIRSRLKVLIAEKEVAEHRKISYEDIQKATGISTSALSSLANSDTTRFFENTLTKLCEYFNCQVGDLLVYVPDEEEER